MIALLRTLATCTVAAALTTATCLVAPSQAAPAGDGAYHLFQTPGQMARAGRAPPRIPRRPPSPSPARWL